MMATDTGTQLPPEIWMRIISFLHGRPSYVDTWPSQELFIPLSTLANLCSTSKFLQSLAEPILYKAISNNRDVMLCDFVYAIFDNPRLWAHVREVVVELGQTLDSYTNPIDDGKVEFFKMQAQEYGLTQIEEEYNGEGLETLNDVCIKLVCLKAQNLQKLSVYVATETALQKVFLDDNDSRILAPNLSELSFEDPSPDYYGLNYGTDVLRYSGLFNSPKLEKLHFRVFDSICQKDDSVSSPESSQGQSQRGRSHGLGIYSQIKSLHFVESVLSAEDIAQIGKSFPSIEDFEYSYKPINEERAIGFRGSRLKPTLNRWTGTLKRLSLDFTYFYDDGRGDRKEDFLESMSAFQNLEELQVESLFLLRERSKQLENGSRVCDPEDANLWSDYFPHTLRCLRINRTYRNIEDPLRILVDNVRDWLPNLEVIHVSFGHWTATPGYADFDVSADTLLTDIYEPILTDEDIVSKLKTEFMAEDMTVISHPRWEEAEVPRRIVETLDTDSISSWALSAAAIQEYIGGNIKLTHLPDLWQEIVTKLNDAGVRVKIDNRSLESVSFDTGGQMCKIEWEAMRNIETKMY